MVVSTVLLDEGEGEESDHSEEVERPSSPGEGEEGGLCGKDGRSKG